MYDYDSCDVAKLLKDPIPDDVDMSEDGTSYVSSLEDAIEEAETQGLTTVYAQPNQLFVDIDSEKNRLLFLNRVVTMAKHGLVKETKITRSKSGNWHGVVTLTKPMKFAERVALQCVLGSDLLHEFLSLMTYVHNGEDTPIVFFEKTP